MFRNIVSRKWERGQKIYFICYDSGLPNNEKLLMTDTYIFSYECHKYADDTGNKTSYNLCLRKFLTNVEETKLVIRMIDENIFSECRKHLMNFLPLLNIYKFPVPLIYLTACPICVSTVYVDKDESVQIRVNEPEWSNCVKCVLMSKVTMILNMGLGYFRRRHFRRIDFRRRNIGRMEHWPNRTLVERNIGRTEHWSNGTFV